MLQSINAKQKIVLAINDLQGAGAERFVLTLGKAFYELGFEVHILCFNPKIEYEFPNFLHYHLIEYKKFRWLPDNSLRYMAIANATDKYIHINIGVPILILSNLPRSDRIFSYSKLENIAFVIHNTLSQLHKFEDKQTAKKLEIFKKIYATHPCICVSRGAQEDFVKFFNPPRLTAILNPIDRAEIQRLSTAFSPDVNNYILHIGSFKPAKRHDILLQAYAKTDKSLPLVLLGQGSMRPEIDLWIQKLHLQDKVRLLGFCSNPYPYIKQANFQVLSSDWEGLPLVILEALALNTPVISTDCPSGPNELLPHKNLVAVGDIEELAQKIQQAINNPLEFQSEFDNKFLPINVAKQYLAFMGVV